MTVFAHVRRRDVCIALADRIRAVVAADTVADDTGMIEAGRYPGGSHVAIVTLVTGGDMRRCLASGLDAVVAAYTAPGKGRMVDECDHAPAGRDVAIRALAGRGHVVRRLG